MRSRVCYRTVTIEPLSEEELIPPDLVPIPPRPLLPGLRTDIDSLEDSTFKRMDNEVYYAQPRTNYISTLADHLTRPRKRQRNCGQDLVEREFNRNRFYCRTDKKKCYSVVMNGDIESRLNVVWSSE